MTAANTFSSGREEPQGQPSNRLTLLILLMLVLPLRGWLMWNTEVLARDSVIYINYAMEIERLSWKKALLSNHHHPGYPLSIWAVSVPVRWLLGPADSFTMQLSAQLASSLAALLLIIPMYFLGRFFFERRVAFWGTLLYQYLPVSGQHLSDGVSEALFLLLTTSAFLCSLWALRRQSLVLFVGCGIFCGLAYLTRPEGALVIVSTVLVLCIGPLIPAWRQTWKLNFRHAVVMTVAGLAVGSLYFGFTHTFTRKPSKDHILFGRPQKPVPGSTSEQRVEIGIRQGETGGPPLFASIFGNAVERNVPLLNRLGKGMFIFGAEYFQIFHYVGFLALVFGTNWRLRRLLALPEFLVPCLFVLLHCILILGLACNAGYLSNRHLLGVAIWGVFFSAAGFCDFPSRLVHWWRGKEWLAIFWSASEDPSTPTRSASERLPYRMSLVLLLAFIGLCLPRTTQKLHANQVGNHQAGLWLAKNLKNVDFIRDDHNWSFYYAGEIFAEPPAPPRGHDPKCFVVITRSRDPEVKKQQTWQEKDLRNGNAVMVYRWPENASEENARVVVFSVHRQEQRWWNERP